MAVARRVWISRCVAVAHVGWSSVYLADALCRWGSLHVAVAHSGCGSDSVASLCYLVLPSIWLTLPADGVLTGWLSLSPFVFRLKWLSLAQQWDSRCMAVAQLACGSLDLACTSASLAVAHLSCISSSLAIARRFCVSKRMAFHVPNSSRNPFPSKSPGQLGTSILLSARSPCPSIPNTYGSSGAQLK